MKINKQIRIIFYLIIAFLVLNACTSAGKIDISLSAENKFPVISISNPSGKDVIINPASSTKGSIGFQKDGLINWVKGMPSIQNIVNGENYIWGINSGTKIKLQAVRENDDLSLQLSLVNEASETPDKRYINFKAGEDEYLTGLFERVVDGRQNLSWQEGIKTAMNLRGENVEMKLKPTVSAYAPFYVSSASYGFFVRGTWP